MTWKLFGTRSESRAARLTFRPVLETLETREVLTGSVGLVNAAIQDVTIQLQALKINLVAGNYSGANSVLQTISSDFGLLQGSAAQLDPASRLQVDSSLISNGLSLVQMGVGVLPQNPALGINLAVFGGESAFAGFVDQFITSQYGIQQGIS